MKARASRTAAVVTSQPVLLKRTESAPGTTERLGELIRARDIAGMAKVVDDDLLAHFVVEAGWDDLADALHARYDGLADRVVLYFGGVTWQQDRDAFARLGEVARAVASR